MDIKEKTDIKKCLKSYLVAKKYYDSDLNKSYEYLKQCNKILNELRTKNISNDLIEIIDETETECSKILSQVIQTTIEKPIIKKKIQINDDEIFEIIETGDIEKLKQYKYEQINFNIYNHNGLTPLHYAIKFGDVTLLKGLFKLGGCIDQSNKYGHTLLEYACLEKDPNMINFLTEYGADMKKHLKFRDGKKYFNNGNEIDILLIEKMILNSDTKYTEFKYLNFLFKYIDKNEELELGYCEANNSTKLVNKILFSDFILKLDNLLDLFDEERRNTFISIITEELGYDLIYKLGCPSKKLHIILYNLVPFIEYNDNLKLKWLLSLEIKYSILKILKNKINLRELKKQLSELLYEGYITNSIIPKGFLQLIVLQWIYKIKV